MSLEALKNEILKSANSRKEEILKEAREKAEKIIEDAKEKAEKIVARKRESVIKNLSEKKKAALAVTRLEGKKKVMMKKDEIVKLVFDEVRKKLLTFKKEEPKKYVDVITGYIIESLEGWSVDEINIRVSKEDYGLIKKNLKKISDKVSDKVGRKIVINLLDEPVDVSGGVVISDKEDKVFYTNTFDSRLIRLYEEERDEVLNILFGE